MSQRINHLAVWAAAIAYFLFGFVWYTIFSVPWNTMLGRTAPLPPTPPVLVTSFLLGVFLAYGTAIALTRRPEDQTLAQGVSFAVFMGVVVYASQSYNHAIYEGQPFFLWFIDTAYTIIGFAIVGAIVGAWKGRVTAS